LRETAWWAWEDSNLQPNDYQRILVAANQPDNRWIIRDMLAPTDYAITEAENGEQVPGGAWHLIFGLKTRERVCLFCNPLQRRTLKYMTYTQRLLNKIPPPTIQLFISLSTIAAIAIMGLALVAH